MRWGVGVRPRDTNLRPMNGVRIIETAPCFETGYQRGRGGADHRAKIALGGMGDAKGVVTHAMMCTTELACSGPPQRAVV